MEIRDVEAEHRLLSIAIGDGKMLDDVEEFVSLFMHHEQKLATILCQLRLQGQPINDKLVYDRDEKAGVMFQKLAARQESVETKSYLINRLREFAVRRKAAAFAEGVHQKAVEGVDDIDDFIDTLEADSLSIRHARDEKAEGNLEACKELVRFLEWRGKNHGKVVGEEFGFGKTCAFLDGLQKGHFVVVGASPATGKTAIALSWADSLECPCAIFSLEMTKRDLLARLASQRSRVPLKKTDEHGQFKHYSQAEFSALSRAISGLSSDTRITIDDEVMNIDRMVGKIRRFVRDRGVRVVFVDYLQLIRAGGRYKGDRRNEVGECSNKLKAVAKELGITVVALAQLARKPQVFDKELGISVPAKPRITDLKETSDIEQDADAICLLWRDIDNDPFYAELIVGKNRHGQTGVIKLDYHGDIYTFKES